MPSGNVLNVYVLNTIKGSVNLPNLVENENEQAYVLQYEFHSSHKHPFPKNLGTCPGTYKIPKHVRKCVKSAFCFKLK